MIPGFKTGPLSWEEGKSLVLNEKAQMCEIWFRVDKSEEYNEYFKWLAKHQITIGLHHWAVCKGGIKNNLSTHNKEVRNETIAQIKESINISSEYGCVYVNIHPGALFLEKVTLSPWASVLMKNTKPTEETEANKLTLEAAIELDAYAKKKGTMLFVETIPSSECIVGGDRNNVYQPQNTSLEVMKDLAREGITIANDLAHTAAFIENNTTPSKKDLWQTLINFTEATHAATKLLHVNTLQPPYNGTDSHDGITDENFAAGVLPNEEQMKEILGIFKERDDIYLVPEPKQNMKENHLALKKMVAEL
jgi:hypothetical protein